MTLPDVIQRLQGLRVLTYALTAINDDSNRDALDLALAALAEQDSPVCEHCGLPLTCASARAELIHGLNLMLDETRSRAETIDQRYHELLYQVSNKYPDETRHQTALRYLRQAEQPPSQSHGTAAKDA